MSGRRALATAAALALSLGAAPLASAAGTIDTGFGSGGAATGPFGLGARAAAVALAPGGAIVVAGDQRAAGGEGALTARFGAAGAPDTTFAGSGGRIDRFGTGATPQRAGAVAVQGDGATIIAGVAGEQWAFARFLPTGLTDGLFGAAGVTLRDPSPGGAPPEEFYPDEEPSLPDGTGPAAIAIAPSGQIVVAGNVGVHNDDDVPSDEIVVARLNDRGVPDPAFGRDGFAVLQLGFGSAIRHASSAARALVLLADGRILIAGRASARDGGDRAFVARLTAAGRLDTSFARQGRALVQLGRASAARVASSSLEALVQRPDGRLVASGRATDVAGADALLLAGFTASGALDGAFARRGSAVTQHGAATVGSAPPRSLARALALQPDGAAVVAGAATGGALAARYGVRGAAVVAGAATGGALAARYDVRGAAVVAGAATGGALAARYDARGALDCGYGTRGRTLAFGGSGFDPGSDGAAAAALQPDGKLLLAGRRAGGGLLLGRLLGGAPSAAPRAAAPRLVTVAARSIGRGRGYAYGLVDGGCRAVDVRFTVAGASGPALSTRVQRVFGRFGPQVVCAPLRGLRTGRRYRIRIEASPRGAAHGAVRVVRVPARSRRALPQEGCR